MGLSGIVLCDLKHYACRKLRADRASLSSAELKSTVNGDQQNDDSQTDSEASPVQQISERKLMAKIDLHLLPCLCILYLLAFLDR